MNNIVFYILFFFNFSLVAQDDWNITLDFGNNQYNSPSSVAPAEDGGILVTGTIKFSGSNEIFFSKIKSNGEIEFTTYYSTSEAEEGEYILLLSNGNYAILGVGRSGSCILIFNKEGSLIDTIELGIVNVYANKIIELNNGDFLFAGSIIKDGIVTSSPNWSGHFARVSKNGQLIWSKSIESDTSDSILDAAVFEDIIIGCGFTNDGGPTDAFAVAIELETGNFVWRKKHNSDVLFSDIKTNEESIFMTGISKISRTHIIEINKSGLTKRNFYSDQESTRGVSLLLGNHPTEFYTGEDTGTGSELPSSKSKVVHYDDHELICELTFKDGDRNRFKGLTYTTDQHIAGIVEISENNKNFTQVFKTPKICDLLNSEEAAKLNIKVSPNPANDFITINFPSENFMTVKLINMQGVLVKEKSDFASNSKLTTANIPSGIYILQLWSDKGLELVETVSVTH